MLVGKGGSRKGEGSRKEEGSERRSGLVEG